MAQCVREIETLGKANINDRCDLFASGRPRSGGGVVLHDIVGPPL